MSLTATLTHRLPANVQRIRGIAALTLALCLGLQFFFSSNFAFDNHPLAPRLLMEATYGALLVYATYVVAGRIRNGSLTSIDLFCYLTPIALIFLSTLFAWIFYKQPVAFGIAENRKALSFLLWFLYDAIRRKYELDTDAVFRSLVFCAAIYFVLGILVQTFAKEFLLARDIPDLDPRKLRITSPGDCFMLVFFFGVVSLACKGLRIYLLPASIGLAGLLLISQTRQITLLCMLIALASFCVLRPVAAFKAGVVGIGVITVCVIGFEFDPLEPVFNFILRGGDSLTENVRAHTAQIIVRVLAENYFVGRGALSVMFDGGFQRFYGPYFWLNDVGILGELFRTGFLWPLFLLFYLRVFAGEYARMRSFTDRAVILTILTFLIVLAATQGFFFNQGHIHAFLFLAVASGRVRARLVDRRS